MTSPTGKTLTRLAWALPRRLGYTTAIWLMATPATDSLGNRIVRILAAIDTHTGTEKER